MRKAQKSPELAGNGAAVFESGQQSKYISNPRQQRVLRALLSHPSIAREQCDKIARASNGPDVISALRDAGLRIRCERVSCRDFDGKRSHYGRYSLHPDDRRKARQMLRVPA